MTKSIGLARSPASSLETPKTEPVQASGPAAWLGKTTGCETGTVVERHCAAAVAATRRLPTTATTQALAVIQVPRCPIIVSESSMLRPASCLHAMVRRLSMERPQTQTNKKQTYINNTITQISLAPNLTP